MKDISIFPGDYVWTSNGTHEVDEKGFAIKSNKHTVVSFADDLFHVVYSKIRHERETNDDLYLGCEKEKLWVLAKSDLVQAPRGTFLSTVIPGYYEVKECPVMCIKTHALCEEAISFVTEYVAKKQPKVLKTETEEAVMENYSETVYIDEPVYDQTLNAYVIQKVPREMTGERNVYDTFDLYDAAGTIVGTHKVMQMKTVTKEVPVLDEHGDPVMEDVVDANGAVVMEPKISTKYVSETGEERTLENYEQQTEGQVVYKAILVDALIIDLQLQRQCCPC